MIQRVLVVAGFELRATMRRRSYQVMTALLPILGLLAIGAIRLASSLGGDGDGAPTSQGYVDLWGRLPAEAPAELRLQAYGTEDAARADLRAGAISAYYVVPADYLESGRVVRYTQGRGELVPRTGTIELLLTRTLLKDAVSPEVMARVQAPVRLEAVSLTPDGMPAPPRDEFSAFAIPYFFSLLLTFSIFATSGFLLQSVTEEKQSRTIEVVLSSVPASTLLAGKVLGLGAAGLLQIAVWVLSARVLTETAGSVLALPSIRVEPEVMVLGMVFFLLGYLFFATVMAGIGSIATSLQEGNQIAGLITVTAVVPLMLMPMILNGPDGAVARVLTYIPSTAPITLMLRLSAPTVPWLDVFGAGAVLLMAAAGALALAGRLFRTYLLLYGRRPGFREVWRTLRSG